MLEFLERKLQKRNEKENRRVLQNPQPHLIDFCSNDYLGLARSKAFARRIEVEIARQPPESRAGATGSRLLTGNFSYAEGLEARIAHFHGYASGTLFNCGYMANIGLLTTILDSESVVFYDAAIHASTHDGIRLSKAQAFPFRHNDPFHLENRLKKCPKAKNRVICIESIYSTDGSLAPLSEICTLAKEYGAYVILDEAHATGAMGPQGRGLAAQLNRIPEIFAQVITFGKALGAHGAIVLGCQTLKQALINFANPYIYTIAMPFPSLAAIRCAYDLFPHMDMERDQLKSLVKVLQAHLITASGTHIQPISIPGNRHAKKMGELLSHHGYDVRPLLSPTVRQGQEILRICLHAYNREEELAQLLHLIEPAQDCKLVSWQHKKTTFEVVYA